MHIITVVRVGFWTCFHRRPRADILVSVCWLSSLTSTVGCVCGMYVCVRDGVARSAVDRWQLLLQLTPQRSGDSTDGVLSCPKHNKHTQGNRKHPAQTTAQFSIFPLKLYWPLTSKQVTFITKYVSITHFAILQLITWILFKCKSEGHDVGSVL